MYQKVYSECVVEKKYKEIKMEIEGFSTALLNLGLENKKVILIGLRTKTRKKFSNFADIKKYYSTL